MILSDINIFLEILERSSLDYEVCGSEEYSSIKLCEGCSVVYIDFDEYGNVE